MSKDSAPKDAMRIILSENADIKDVKKAGFTLFEFLYCTKKQHQCLHDLRYQSYMKMASKGILKPEALPPSVGAAEVHCSTGPFANMRLGSTEHEIKGPVTIRMGY